MIITSIDHCDINSPARAHQIWGIILIRMEWLYVFPESGALQLFGVEGSAERSCSDQVQLKLGPHIRKSIVLFCRCRGLLDINFSLTDNLINDIG